VHKPRALSTQRGQYPKARKSGHLRRCSSSSGCDTNSGRMQKVASSNMWSSTPHRRFHSRVLVSMKRRAPGSGTFSASTPLFNMPAWAVYIGCLQLQTDCVGS
jgi:hypothetical protein